MQTMIDGLILAGGRSSRMGTDKSGLVLPDGMSLIARAYELLKVAVNGCVWVSRSWDYHNGNSYDLCDDEPYAGPLSGIERAMGVSQANYLAVLAVDLPFLPLNFYSWLLTKWQEPVDALMPRSHDHKQPLAGFWSLQLMPALQSYRQEGGRNVEYFLVSRRIGWVQVPDSWIVNINTPGDWESCLLRFRPEKGS